MALAGWKYYREIQIDNTNGNADLIDYQICVELNYSNFDFTKPKSDGGDIRFTNSDKTTLLSYWIENYDAEYKTATIWVKVPLIPKNSTKSIYIWYGNKNATSESDDLVMTFGFVSNVDPFGDGSGVALYQLDGNANDAGGNYNGTWYRNEQYDTGKFGQAVNMVNTPASTYIKTPIIDRQGSKEITISGWIKVAGDTGNWVSVWHLTPDDNDNIGNSRQPGLWLHSTDNRNFHISNDGINTANLYIEISNGNITYNEWHFITQIVTLRRIKFYIDGMLTDTYNSNEDFKFNNGYFYIGDKWYSKNHLIDQTRIFNRALTAEEVAILYHNDIYAIGEESESINGSKLSGVVCDKNGNPITGATVKVFVFDKDSGELYGKTTSNSTDGTWSNNQITAPPNTKVLTVFALEGDYNGDTDIAGAEFDITQEGS